MSNKRKNNIIDFPSSPTKIERQVEAILFAASEPLDVETIIMSVNKTGRLLVIDNGWKTYGISAEIISIIAEKLPNCKTYSRMGTHENSIPSTQSLAKYYYPTPYLISKKIFQILKIDDSILNNLFKEKFSSDQPDPSFTGPF